MSPQELKKKALAYHCKGKPGKVAIRSTKPCTSGEELSLAYTPGVAQPCLEIKREKELVWKYTARSNTVAVVSDGTAVLGLGNIGAEAGLPVMEGKAVLFKAFGDVDAWPVPLDCCRVDGKSEGKTDPERVIAAVKAIAPQYGGINLEDIASPACFEIEDRLDAELDIPVFHDDQWGTAVITLSGVMNYAKLAGRSLKDLTVVMNGAGAAGIRICEMLKAAGVERVTMCDRKGTIRKDRTDLNGYKARHAVDTKAQTLREALVGADVFIGVSAANVRSGEDVKKMSEFPAIFAMANPDPEIAPAEVAAALSGRKYVMVTGRSDYPNQINNVLGFPYLFRGALDAMASTINKEMKVAAAEALAALAEKPVPEDVKAIYPGENLEFGTSYIIPKPFDRRLFVEVSHAVAAAAVRTGVARKSLDLAAYREELERRNAVR